MTIQFAKGSPEITAESLRAWLPEINRRAQLAGIGVGAEVAISQGYKVAYISAKTLREGNGIGDHQLEHWRHLIVSESHVLGEIELDASHNPLGVHWGPSKDGLSAAVRQADALKLDYEAHVIEAPSVHFVGLWLHSQSEDLVIPYPPNLTALKNFQVISYDRALSVLKEMAGEVPNLETDEGFSP